VPWKAPLWRAPGPLNPLSPLNPQRTHSAGFLHREPVCRPTQEIDRPPSLESSCFSSFDSLLHTVHRLLAGLLCFSPPCASGLCVKRALSRASFRCRCWLAIFQFLSSPCSRPFPIFSFSFVALGFIQPFQASPTSLSQSRSPRCPCCSRSFFWVVFFALPLLSFLHSLLAALDVVFNGTCNHSFFADPSWTPTPVHFACFAFLVQCLPSLLSRPLIYDKRWVRINYTTVST
jgi:hypothetical protein